MLKTQLSLEMKVLVTGDNLVFLIRVVNTLLNFDTVLVKIKMTAKSLVFTATNCFDGCVMHMFHPLFFSVFDNSEVESDTIVQVKHLVDCFKMIRMLENLCKVFSGDHPEQTYSDYGVEVNLYKRVTFPQVEMGMVLPS